MEMGRGGDEKGDGGMLRKMGRCKGGDGDGEISRAVGRYEKRGEMLRRKGC